MTRVVLVCGDCSESDKVKHHIDLFVDWLLFIDRRHTKQVKSSDTGQSSSALGAGLVQAPRIRPDKKKKSGATQARR